MATTLFILLVSIITVAGSINAATTAARGNNFIKTSCSATTYPDVCVRSLAIYAGTIQNSHHQLAQTALSVSLTKAQWTKSFMSKLKRFKGLKKREYAAIEDCLEEMEDTVDRLSQSVEELKQIGGAKGSEFVWRMSNVETWVSAALTDESTCVDGFAGRSLDGKVKSSVKAQILHVAQVTSNALALINRLADQH